MKKELSKRLKSIIADLAAKAHEREVRQRLEKLSDCLAHWKRGAIDTWDAIRELDRFRTNTKRLAQKYQRSTMTPLVVAGAIAAGFLRENEVSKEVLETLEQEIKFFKDGFADGTLSLADDDD